jgi:hypothetical protein
VAGLVRHSSCLRHLRHLLPSDLRLTLPGGGRIRGQGSESRSRWWDPSLPTSTLRERLTKASTSCRPLLMEVCPEVFFVVEVE